MTDSRSPGQLRQALLITNIPTPYRIPLFVELSRQLTARSYRLKVVFAAMGYSRRQWRINLDGCGFDYEILTSRPWMIGRSESVSFTYPGLSRLIQRDRPDVILVSGYSIATVKLWLRSLFRPTPYILWSGTIDSQHDSFPRLRQWQRRLLVSRASAFVAYGSMARDYLIRLGAPRDRIQIATNTVDTEFFRRESQRLRTNTASQEFLYIGDLSERKRPDLLIQAFARLAKRHSAATLRLVGDGPARGVLERMVRELGIGSRVHFDGYRQRSELPAYLARACCFVFPTGYDIWGLVLTEALAAGLPCIASVNAGATHDLIQDGVTGFQVDFTDVESVAQKMGYIVEHPLEAQRMGLAASQFIRERASLTVSAAGLVRAVETVGANGSGPAKHQSEQPP